MNSYFDADKASYRHYETPSCLPKEYAMTEANPLIIKIKVPKAEVKTKQILDDKYYLFDLRYNDLGKSWKLYIGYRDEDPMTSVSLIASAAGEDLLVPYQARLPELPRGKLSLKTNVTVAPGEDSYLEFTYQP